MLRIMKSYKRKTVAALLTLIMLFSAWGSVPVSAMGINSEDLLEVNGETENGSINLDVVDQITTETIELDPTSVENEWNVDESADELSVDGSDELTEEEIAEEILSEEAQPVLLYKAHRQTYGDTDWVTSGQECGTTGQGKRLENLAVKVEGVEGLGVTYRTYVQSYGWCDWASDGEEAGTRGQGKRLEAVQIKLTGENADEYSIYYRVHTQSFDWLGWTKDGQIAGSLGFAKRMESIQIFIVPKSIDTYTLCKKFSNPTDEDRSSSYVGEYEIYTRRPCVMLGKASEDMVGNSGLINYWTHVQTYGDQNWVSDGNVSGTTGEAKRLEQISIKLGDIGYSGGITYRTHVQSYGWMNWVSDGEKSGTTGEAKRLEAIQMKLTGEVAEHYDVYYRVHCQKIGWMDWAKNGESAGTAGYAFRLEGIQIVLVKKDKIIDYRYSVGFNSQVAAPFIDGTGGVTSVVKVCLDNYNTPYVWGGSNWGKGVDCSGMTMLAYKSIGINLPHYSGALKNCGREIPNDLSKMRAGDLLIYDSPEHVAMYMGGGVLIHATGGSTLHMIPYSYWSKPSKVVRIVN